MKLTEPPAVVSQAQADVKQVFRNGWSNPSRVQGWSKGTIRGEFANPAARAAWKRALALATADLTPGDAVDMGTGPSTISQLWAEAGWRTTGVDFSPTMLAMATEALAERGLSVELIEGDVERPPLAGRSFDVISSRLVLFTLPHPGMAIRRWVQLLRPGGRLILIGEDHNERRSKHPPEGPPADEMDRQRPKDQPPRAGGWHADAQYHEALSKLHFMYHSSGELQAVMEAAGLEQVWSVPVPDVIAARKVLAERENVEFRVFRSQPFVIVGRKPDAWSSTV